MTLENSSLFTSLRNLTSTASSQTPFKHLLLASLTPWALTLALSSSPLLQAQAIPYPVAPPSSVSPTTPFSQSQNLKLGLENGKIRPCPSTNPGCISTNPKSASFASPWMIPENATQNAIQKLRDAIEKTQENVEFKVDEDTPYGHYMQVEIAGTGLTPDVLEFLVKKDVVLYRSMATKVTYLYPFTTALGDCKGQKERVKRITDELGWFAPDIELMDS